METKQNALNLDTSTVIQHSFFYGDLDSTWPLYSLIEHYKRGCTLSVESWLSRDTEIMSPPSISYVTI